jgi:hypothetical protein
MIIIDCFSLRMTKKVNIGMQAEAYVQEKVLWRHSG